MTNKQQADMTSCIFVAGGFGTSDTIGFIFCLALAVLWWCTRFIPEGEGK